MANMADASSGRLETRPHDDEVNSYIITVAHPPDTSNPGCTGG